MSTNYSENIFQSIDTIISQKLNEVSFDRTIVGTIIKKYEDSNTKYLVSSNGLKFDAYAQDDKEYLEQIDVYILIPDGDYSKNKLIIGRYGAEDDLPKDLYTNPFNHLVTSSTISLDYQEEDFIICAKVNNNKYDDWNDSGDENYPNTITKSLQFLYKNKKDFDYIGLDFAFNTDISGYTGSYALQLSFWNGDTNLAPNNDNLIISSKNLYGNPYNFTSQLSFQHLFPWPTEITNITEITDIQLKLIQDNKFQDENNNNKIIKLVKAELKFGYDVKFITKDELQLYLEEGQSLKYTTGQTGNAIARTLYLDWKHLDSYNNSYIFNNTQLPTLFDEYTVYWLRYVDGLGKNNDLPDEYGWNWETININQSSDLETAFSQNITLVTLYNTDQYKAIIKYKYKNSEDAHYIVSDGLVFDNTNVAAQPGAANSSEDSLRIKLDENDTGVYNVYGLDSHITNNSYKGPHNIHFEFLDTTPLDRIANINWEFPTTNTMIVTTEEERNKQKQYNTFNIDTMYKPGAMNNRIWCTVTLKTGEIRRGSLTLQFGEATTAGSNYAFNIDFVGHKTCLYATEKNDTVEIQATFTKKNGEVMTVPTITWSWVNDYESPVTLSNTSGEKITLTYNSTEVPEDNYSILQATIANYPIDNGLTTDLTAYLPIPIAKSKEYNYISGATRIVYALDNQSYTKSNDGYQLYKSATEIENAYWKINNTTFNGIPKLRGETIDTSDYYLSGCTLRPTSYEAQEIPMVNIVAYSADTQRAKLWAQPILILSNRWQSETINDWNGTVEIDKEAGNIKAPFFMAGKKEENTLTGLVIGDLEGASVAEGTGIYGFKNGKPRYYLTDSGKFYVGYADADTESFISFNENVTGRSGNNELLIKTNKFILDTPKLNINSTASDKAPVIKFDDKFELRANGTATIGGWNIANNKLYAKPGDNTGAGMAGTGSKSVAFWAGYDGKGDTPWDITDWQSHTKFYVYNSGELHAKGADIEGKVKLEAGSTMNGNDISQYSTFEVTKDKISSEVVDEKLKNYSTIAQTDTKISAKVSKTSGAVTNGTGWNLTSTAWTVSSYINGTKTDVLTVNKDGLTVKGTVQADSGNIGGWILDDHLFYKTNGTYTMGFDFNEVGNTGRCFAIGRIPATGSWGNAAFYITGQGKVVATDGTIGGWTIGPDYIQNRYGDHGVFYLAPYGATSSGKDKLIYVAAPNGATVFEIARNGNVLVSGNATFNGTIYSSNGSTIKGTSELEYHSIIGGFEFTDTSTSQRPASYTMAVKNKGINYIDFPYITFTDYGMDASPSMTISNTNYNGEIIIQSPKVFIDTRDLYVFDGNRNAKNTRTADFKVAYYDTNGAYQGYQTLHFIDGMLVED